MSRKSFLIATSVFAILIGCVCIFFPVYWIVSIKLLSPCPSAVVMTRTSGVLFITIGIINFLVKDENNSSLLRSVFVGNLILQIGILLIELIAYFEGLYFSVFSIIPSTITHVLLTIGFLSILLKMGKPDK